MSDHINHLEKGEGINYEMLFVEKEEYIKKYLPDSKVEEEVIDGVKVAKWYVANKIISPWHDIPHMPDKASVSFVCEIPKF